MQILDGGKKKFVFTGVAFDPTGALVVAGCDTVGRAPTILWDVRTGALLGRFDPLGATSRSLRFHPRTGHLLVPTNDGLKVYDTTTRDMIGAVANGVFIGTSAFDPVGDLFVCVHSGQRLSLSAFRWSSAAGEEPLWRVPVFDTPHEYGGVDYLACLGDGERLVTVEQNLRRLSHDPERFRITIRARSDGRLLQRSTGVCSLRDCAFALHHTGAFVAMTDQSLRVYSIGDLEAPRVLESDSKKRFTGIAFHPSGRYLAVTSNDETVKLYDTTTWQVARTFAWGIGRMRSICFSPDGALAAAGSDTGKIVVWDVDI